MRGHEEMRQREEDVGWWELCGSGIKSVDDVQRHAVSDNQRTYHQVGNESSSSVII